MAQVVSRARADWSQLHFSKGNSQFICYLSLTNWAEFFCIFLEIHLCSIEDIERYTWMHFALKILNHSVILGTYFVLI